MKPDSKQFRTVLANLAEADWVKRTERRWWPSFIFHYTDIRNAIRILQGGYLYNREFLTSRNALPVSSGSDVVLSTTDERIKSCVRLYFRPQTPTQYYAEGVRSQKALVSSRFSDAHCPVPIFFLFDAAAVLSIDNCLFSDKNLGSHDYKLFSTAAELANLDWRKIYHTGPVNRANPTESSDIISCRSAEVIVPYRLDLSALRFIYCRSEAERDTLLNFLPSQLYRKYRSRIVATTRSNLYFRQHTYVESARLDSESAVLQFSPDTQSPGPFHLQVKLSVDSIIKTAEQDNFVLGSNHKLNIRTGSRLYELQVFLDGHIVFANSFVESIEDDIPF